MSDAPTKDQAKVTDARKGDTDSGANTGLKFEGYKLPASTDQILASASGTRDVGLSPMGDQLKNLQMAQLGSSDASKAGTDGKKGVSGGRGETTGDKTAVADNTGDKPAISDQAAISDKSGEKPILEVKNRGTSDAFAKEVADGVASLPPKVAQELKDKGVQVNVFKNIYEYDKAMGTHKADMVVNGHKVALDAPSLFDGKGKPPNIAVFEQLGDGTPVKSVKNTDVGGLARHESGHAYSAAHGFLSMQDKNFQGAMINDINNLSQSQMQQLSKEAQPGGPMNYYLGSPAKEEFFAEAFATATGKGSDKYADKRMQELFPNVMKYMRESTK